MNLLDRYLQAVSRCLPPARRNDIVAELRANILSQFDDRQQDLGRPLTENEHSAILRRHGNPTIIAGRYAAHNLGFTFGIQLIGPELFPAYKTALTVNLLIIVAVLAVVIPIVLSATNKGVTLPHVLVPLVTQFAILTLVFIMLDRYKGQVLDKWDPNTLPALKTNGEDGPKAYRVFNFIALAVGTLWLALTPHWPYLLLGPGAVYLRALPMQLMPDWPKFYQAIVTLLCLQLALQLFSLFRLLSHHMVQRINLAVKAIGLGINVFLLVKAPDYVSSPDQQLADWANMSFLICLIATLSINLWSTGQLSLSLWRNQD